jgi:hypothetical protein
MPQYGQVSQGIDVSGKRILLRSKSTDQPQEKKIMLDEAMQKVRSGNVSRIVLKRSQ